MSGTYDAPGLDGLESLYAYTRIGAVQNGTVLSVGVPRDSVYASANQDMVRSLAFLLVVALFAMVAAALFSEWSLVTPLKALAVTSRRLAGGDLTVRSGLAVQQGKVGAHASSLTVRPTSSRKASVW